MTQLADIATIAIYFGAIVIVFCAFGALAEKHLMRDRSHHRRVRRNLRRQGLL